MVLGRRGDRPGRNRRRGAHRPGAAPAARAQWHLLRAQRNVVLAYGLIAVAACQVCYFNAVDRLSVGVALLLEYLGIVVIVLLALGCGTGSDRGP